MRKGRGAKTKSQEANSGFVDPEIVGCLNSGLCDLTIGSKIFYLFLFVLISVSKTHC